MNENFGKTYYVAVSSKGGKRIFACDYHGDVILTRAGKAIRASWFDIPYYCRDFAYVELRNFSLGPDRIEGVLTIFPKMQEDRKRTKKVLEKIMKRFFLIWAKKVRTFSISSQIPILNEKWYSKPLQQP